MGTKLAKIVASLPFFSTYDQLIYANDNAGLGYMAGKDEKLSLGSNMEKLYVCVGNESTYFKLTNKNITHM